MHVMDEPAPLNIPRWVPHHLNQLISDQYLKNIYLPGDTFGDYQAGYIRLATDERMKPVWQEIYRRTGTGGQERPFKNPADFAVVSALAKQMGLEYLSAEKENFIKIQDQAAAILFFKASGNLLWDRRLDVGPRVKTIGEINKRKSILQNLINSHLEDAESYEKLGKFSAAKTLKGLASDLSTEVNTKLNFDNNPWVVERSSNRVGDAWERGAIIELGQICLSLFNQTMLRTVTTMSNILLNRNDITHHMVQGVLSNLS